MIPGSRRRSASLRLLSLLLLHLSLSLSPLFWPLIFSSLLLSSLLFSPLLATSILFWPLLLSTSLLHFVSTFLLPLLSSLTLLFSFLSATYLLLLYSLLYLCRVVFSSGYFSLISFLSATYIVLFRSLLYLCRVIFSSGHFSFLPLRFPFLSAMHISPDIVLSSLSLPWYLLRTLFSSTLSPGPKVRVEAGVEGKGRQHGGRADGAPVLRLHQPQLVLLALESPAEFNQPERERAGGGGTDIRCGPGTGQTWGGRNIPGTGGMGQEYRIKKNVPRRV